MKRMPFILSAVLMFTAPGLVLAQPPGYGPRPPVVQQVTGPSQVLREGMQTLLNYLDEGGSRNPARFLAFLEEEIAPYFDFAQMTRWVAGPRFRYLTPDQRAEMREQLQEMFLGAMAEKLATYQKASVRYYTPRRSRRRGEVTLGVQAVQRGQYPLRLEFRMYRTRRGWKIYDVSANGQSALIYYRSQFAQRGRGRPMSGQR